MQRHGISRLPQVEGDRQSQLQDLPDSFFHINFAEVRTEQDKLHLFVGIDRTPKSAFGELHEKAINRVAGDFLRHLIAAVPVACTPS